MSDGKPTGITGNESGYDPAEVVGLAAEVRGVRLLDLGLAETIDRPAAI
jgi:hypothetical protein